MLCSLVTFPSPVSSLTTRGLSTRDSFRSNAPSALRARPLCILAIRLAAGDSFHRLGIDEHDLEETLHQVKDGLPIHPGRLHSHMTTLGLLPPVDQSE